MKTIIAIILCLFSIPVMAEEPTISVAGEASVEVSPDIGYINFGVVSKSDVATKALNENSISMNSLMIILSRFVEKKDIKTVSYNFAKHTARDRTGQVTFDGYYVSNVVRVTVHKLEDMGKIIDSAVNSGANSVDSISFDSTELKHKLSAARSSAILDAKNKATEIATALGSSGVEILSVSESGRNSVYYASESVRFDSDTSISGGTLTYKVNLSTVWKIKK